MAKASKAGMNKKAIQFVRDHVETKLVRCGWDPQKACDMVACCSDEEIQECLGKQKVGALGDGRFLKWLGEHKEEILSAVEKVFTLLSLFATKPPQGGEESSGEESEENADEGEEDTE